MHRHVERQAHALLRRDSRPADAKSRDRKDVLRQPQQFGHRRRPIADHANRACAEPLRLRGQHERRERDPGIDTGVEERVEVIVGERLAAPFVPLPLAAVVAAEDQQHRDLAQPCLPGRALGERRENFLFQPRIVHDDDVALLEIAFGRRAQCERTEPVQQFKRHRICRKPSDHAARRELRMQRRRIRGDLQMRVVCSKPALER